MFRSRQRGWIALPDRALQAKGNDIPHGVFGGPARAVHIAQGCRSAEDTDTVRKSPGLPLLLRRSVKVAFLVGSSKTSQPLRCTASPTHQVSSLRRGPERRSMFRSNALSV